jgi:hypothetical protein
VIDEPAQKPAEVFNVRKNNFFNDDTSSVSSYQSVTFLKPNDKSVSCERNKSSQKNAESLSKKMAQRIVKNAV